MIPKRDCEVPEILEHQEIPLSDEVRMVPSGPTATNDTVESHVVVSSVVPVVVPVAEYSSLSSLQEIMVRLKQEIKIMNRTFFIELQYALDT